MAVDPKLVKELRVKTGVGISECKKALEEANGDFEKAAEILKKYGSKVAAKKADRVAKEGKTNVFIGDNKVVIVEVNCETDFVAKNENFEQLVDKIGEAAIQNDVKDVEELKNVKIGDLTVDEFIKEAIGKIKENIVLRKVVVLPYDKNTSVVGQYVHMNGKVSAVVILNTEGDKSPEVEQLARDIAVQVASLDYEKVSVEDYTEEELNAIKEEILKDSVFEGKPEKVKEMILNNKLNDYFSETVLLEQEFIKDPSKKIKDIINEVSKKIGKTIKVEKTAKLVLGQE